MPANAGHNDREQRMADAHELVHQWIADSDRHRDSRRRSCGCYGKRATANASISAGAWIDESSNG